MPRRLVGEADAGELKAGFWRPEVSVAGADVIGGGGARAAAQHALVVQHFAVVFHQGAVEGLVAGIGLVMVGGPLPEVAAHLRQRTGGACSALVMAVGGGARVEHLGIEKVRGLARQACGPRSVPPSPL